MVYEGRLTENRLGRQPPPRPSASEAFPYIGSLLSTTMLLYRIYNLHLYPYYPNSNGTAGRGVSAVYLNCRHSILLVMGWRPDLQEEIQNAEEPEAGRHGDVEL